MRCGSRRAEREESGCARRRLHQIFGLLFTARTTDPNAGARCGSRGERVGSAYGNGDQVEWTETTWNPVRGCARVSPGCMNCYAERMAQHAVTASGVVKLETTLGLMKTGGAGPFEVPVVKH
ncbi:MAG: DUF5131 family protein [Myxococcaceae bacterium]|nr:DUF5131 family protein [Myxococcaceae bacterium]